MGDALALLTHLAEAIFPEEAKRSTLLDLPFSVNAHLDETMRTFMPLIAESKLNLTEYDPDSVESMKRLFSILDPPSLVQKTQIKKYIRRWRLAIAAPKKPGISFFSTF